MLCDIIYVFIRPFEKLFGQSHCFFSVPSSCCLHFTNSCTKICTIKENFCSSVRKMVSNILNGSRRGSVDKGVGLAIKFRVQIPKRKGIQPVLHWKPCSVASSVGYPSVTPKKKKYVGSLPAKNAEGKKSVSFIKHTKYYI